MPAPRAPRGAGAWLHTFEAATFSLQPLIFHSQPNHGHDGEGEPPIPPLFTNLIDNCAAFALLCIDHINIAALCSVFARFLAGIRSSTSCAAYRYFALVAGTATDAPSSSAISKENRGYCCSDPHADIALRWTRW